MKSKDRPQTTPAQEGIELDPKAWERFGEFVKGIAKAGPQHRQKKEGGDVPHPPSKRKPTSS